MLNMTIKNVAKQIGLVLVIVVIATIIDYFVHSTSERFYVDFEYFRNKIIFATIWGLISLWVLRFWIKSPTALAIGVSAVIAILLQIKYFTQGYNLFFVFLFLFLHFLMFALPAILIFRKYPQLFVKQPK